MSKINRGVVTVVTKHFNKNYFSLGSAFQICLCTNKYRTAVLVKVEDEELKFKVFDKNGEMEDLTITLDNMDSDRYETIKLEPDYINGKLTE
jgi:hypothetical protein